MKKVEGDQVLEGLEIDSVDHFQILGRRQLPDHGDTVLTWGIAPARRRF